MITLIRCIFAAAISLNLPASVLADPCSDRDCIEKQIRQAIVNWTNAANREDWSQTKKIWAPGVQGWFPTAAEFKKAAAFPGRNFDEKAIRTTYRVTINEILVATDLAVVRDTWDQVVHSPNSPATARRTIRSFEVWQPQPDGQWKISRWISAPTHWEIKQ